MRKQLTKYSLELDTILSNRTPSCVTRTFLSLLSSLRWEMKRISPTRGLWISVRSAINALVPRAAPAREIKVERADISTAFGCSAFARIAAFLTGNGPLKSNPRSFDSVHLVARFPGRLSVTRVNWNGKFTDFGCYAIVYLSHSIPFQYDLLHFVIVDLRSRWPFAAYFGLLVNL